MAPGVVSQSIRELRRTLDDSAQAPLWIETRHKLGYRFCGPLERLPDETDIPTSEPSPATSEEQTPSTSPAAAANPGPSFSPLLPESCWWPASCCATARSSDITRVQGRKGISGNGTSGTVVLSLAPNGIVATQIADAQIGTVALTDGAITTAS